MNPTRNDPDARRRRLGMIIRRCRTMTAVLVAEHLARLEAKHGRATDSRANIARAIGRCERSVSRAVGELERAGAVDVWRDPPRKCQDDVWRRRRTNLYRLKWPPRDRVVPGRTEGTCMSRLCDSEAIEPERRRPQVAPTPSSSASASLFDPDPPPDPPPTPSPPPWIAEGIDAAEWIRRQRGAGA